MIAEGAPLFDKVFLSRVVLSIIKKNSRIIVCQYRINTLDA
jgi:hypothetical protein